MLKKFIPIEEKLDLLASISQAFFFCDHRLYFLEFGSSAYAILYYYHEQTDTVFLLRIKHQKEVGF